MRWKREPIGNEWDGKSLIVSIQTSGCPRIVATVVGQPNCVRFDPESAWQKLAEPFGAPPRREMSLGMSPM